MIIKALLLGMVSVLLLCAPVMAGFEFGGKQGFDENEVYDFHFAANVPAGLFSAEWLSRYGKTNRIVTTNLLRATLGYNKPIAPRWSAWADVSGEQNNVAGTTVKKFGLGPKYIIYPDKLSISAGYMNHLIDYEDGSSKTRQRASFRLKWKKETLETKASFISFYQPDIEQSRDYLASAVLSYGLKLSDKQTVRIQIENYYQSIVPDGVERNRVYTLFIWSYE